MKNEPRPAMDILAVLMQKQWPEDNESSLTELNACCNDIASMKR